MLRRLRVPTSTSRGLGAQCLDRDLVEPPEGEEILESSSKAAAASCVLPPAAGRPQASSSPPAHHPHAPLPYLHRRIALEHEVPRVVEKIAVGIDVPALEEERRKEERSTATSLHGSDRCLAHLLLGELAQRALEVKRRKPVREGLL